MADILQELQRIDAPMGGGAGTVGEASNPAASNAEGGRGGSATTKPPFPAPTQVTGATEHGETQISGRDGGHGVNDNAIDEAVKHPIEPPEYVLDQYGGHYEYLGQNAFVSLNEQGEVITAWATHRTGWRNP